MNMDPASLSFAGKIAQRLRWYLPRIAVLYSLVVLAGWAWFAWPLLWPGLLALVLVAISLDGMLRAGSSLFIATVSHGARDSRQVTLSFDDGPDPEVTPALLDLLAQYRARATFFVIGRNLAAQASLGRRIVAEGHQLANHSWQHSYLQNFRLWHWQKEELARCERAIEEISGGASARLYRAPVGMKTADLAHAISLSGLRVVAWSVHSRDTLDPDPQAMARRVLSRVRGGDIILLHDGDRVPGRRKTCAPALQLILEGLKAKGLECVTLTEMLGPTPGAPS
jgi:peptidoglycan/xylan/chitin deacetylase (PgdA/CDA1 family)